MNEHYISMLYKLIFDLELKMGPTKAYRVTSHLLRALEECRKMVKPSKVKPEATYDQMPLFN